MNEHYLATSTSEYGGHWGHGETPVKAKRALRGAGGSTKKKLFKLHRFFSKLEFAPRDRDAKEDEFDCWMGKDGIMSWVRCERELVS